MSAYLKFISGAYQGAEFPLEDPADVLIGRDEMCDVVLTAGEGAEHVALEHARVLVIGNQCLVEPLDADHPTFLNGERIAAPHPLRDGDRVLIGLHLIKYLSERPSAQAPPPPARLDEDPYRHAVVGRPVDARVMSFHSDEVPLEDIIPLFASARRTVAILYTAHPSVGIFLERGRIHWVRFQDEPDPYVAFARILALDPGAWHVDQAWIPSGVTDTPLNARPEQFMLTVFERLEERAKQHGEER